jgi:hypothetical protein
MSAVTASIISIYTVETLIEPKLGRLSPRPLLGHLGEQLGSICGLSNAKSVSDRRRNGSDGFECGWLDVVLSRHTIIGVTEHHRCDVPYANPEPLLEPEVDLGEAGRRCTRLRVVRYCR